MRFIGVGTSGTLTVAISTCRGRQWSPRGQGPGGEYLLDIMTYYFGKNVKLPFDQAIIRVTDRLKEKGFGVLTTIDVSATLKAKLGVNFRPYTILGACNPKFAHKALALEPNVGAMLPCNVVVQRRDDGEVSVSAVDPVASMAAIENPALAEVAGQVRELLKQVIDELD